MKQRSVRKSQVAWERAKKTIHGGVPLLSKKPDRFLPGQWPVYFKKAKGITITDIDGNSWLDFSYMGVGPDLLGYADADVNAAVKKVIDSGNQSTLNSFLDVEFAEEFLKLHPWANRVRFARTGGEIAAIAVRIARAHAKKDIVAVCGYHGWHDWYLATNLADDKKLDGHLLPGLQPVGVPRSLLGTVVPFTYNKIEELESLVEKYPIGTIMMEPMRHDEPVDGFLAKVRAIADRVGAVLIFDEISSGFRLGFPGAHTKFGVEPDIAIYSKAISNGFPMAALVGKDSVMKESEASFISSTYHAEAIGPAAALATLKKMKRVRIEQYVDRIGAAIAKIWRTAAEKYRLPVVVEGPNAFVNFSFEHADALALKALFTQEMLAEGYLATSTVYVSYAHKSSHLSSYAKAVNRAFSTIAHAVQTNTIIEKIKGPLPEVGFKRLT